MAEANSDEKFMASKAEGSTDQDPSSSSKTQNTANASASTKLLMY